MNPWLRLAAHTLLVVTIKLQVGGGEIRIGIAEKTGVRTKS
jgi:hypothetical protein